MFKHTYSVVPPEKAAQHLDADVLTGKDSWFTQHRFAVVTSFLPRDDRQKLLDFGCGNGFFLNYLRRNDYYMPLCGYDPYIIDTSVDSSGKDYQLYRSLDTTHNEKFNFVTALDVIEHIDNDEEALRKIHKILAADGVLLLTVPAYQWLYCISDAAIGHYRRYTKSSVQAVLEKTGFAISHATYFFSFLIPVSIARKYYLSIRHIWRKDHRIDVAVDKWRIFSVMANLELKILQKTGFFLPFGCSLFVKAHKIHLPS